LTFADTQSTAAQIVTVAQAGFTGSFRESDDCAGVASLAALSNGSGKARYNVTPHSKGACSATFSGGGGQAGHLQISVTPSGSVIVNPDSLSFNSSSSKSAAFVRVSQSGFAGSFVEADDCASVATIVASGNAEGKATYVATPLADGSCAATFEGGNAETGQLAVSVKLPHPITATPSWLSFNETGPGAAQTVTLTQAGYSGSFTESDDCSGIATVIARYGGGAAAYAVTPVAAGSCSATFAGGYDVSVSVPIAVTPPGSVLVDPATMNFHATGAGAAQRAVVSQHGYNGSFTESDTCSGIAGIGALTGAKATYAVTPLAAGNCTATFAGGNRETGTLSIAVAPYGRVGVTPSSMTFTATGYGAAQTAKVEQTNYEGTFSEADTCGSIAQVTATTNGYGQAAYAVTPLHAGVCTATFTGGNQETAPLQVDVSPYGAVVVTPAAMTFRAVGSAYSQRAQVSQSGYGGSFAEADDCSGTASVTAVAGSGGSQYTVVGLAQGACSATFTGGNGWTGTLDILVDLPGGVVASPAPLNLALSGTAQGQTVTVTQPKFAGSFGESDTCASFAKVVQLSNGSGTAQYRVTAIGAGTCDIVFTGGNSETFVLHVMVSQTTVVIDGRRGH
jgi:hypothetical protein